MAFFHGKFKVSIIEAEGLPDTDSSFFNLIGKDVTDPYVIGELGNARLFKTRYIDNSLNPNWNEDFVVPVCHNASNFNVKVMDKDHLSSDFIAQVSIRAEDLESGDVIEGWFDLFQGEESLGRINLSVQYIAKAEYEENLNELQDSYFEAREGCRMVLYQDADTPQLPQLDGVCHPDESPYEATRAWRDLYDSIKQAEKFIYITGWSIDTKINLLRGDEDPEGFSNVGELLKAKAEEGVKVLIMAWDEKSSDLSGGEGMMGTHDEETKQFFEGSNVVCKLVPRQKTDGVLANTFVTCCYTHHQKTVICDAPFEEDDSMKRIVAFIGGLDITDGRYDTPEFNLFSTIKSHHVGDFYQNCAPGVTEATGPRQPWHDIHSKVEGPIALDIKKNFEERWCRQSEDLETHLVCFDDSEFALDAPATLQDHDGGPWTIQLFRSITSDSCQLDLEKHLCLHKKSGRLIENSIQQCMIKQIRKANNFIYLENQYFLGSAYAWLDDSQTLSNHLIPKELTERITEKITAEEPFKVYAVIPMFPEGDPASGPSQEILFWQFRTMETMYKRIADAIKENGLDSHPKDYLNFYCLAKRESPEEIPEDLDEPEDGTLAKTLRDSMRHPIYVHSKMTLIDDEYILVGSANINQRSLGGNRDTEIAVGGYQPGHTVAEEENPRGSVHSFRMALWSAHFGGYDEAYLNPNSEDCMNKVRETSQEFWDLYTAEEAQHSDCHILPYPIQVDEDGNVTSLESPFDCFPDTSAPVLGQKTGYLPGKLTT